MECHQYVWLQEIEKIEKRILEQGYSHNGIDEDSGEHFDLSYYILKSQQ